VGAAWRGVHTALVTPFDATGAIDWAAWESLLRRQLAASIHGLVVSGTTGESPTLDADERDRLLSTALDAAGDRAVVTMGVGTNDTRSTVANAERAKALGAHAGLLVLPYYNKPPIAGLVEHLRAAAAPGLPLVVYHVPGRTAQRLPARDLAALCNLPGVVACKEATGDLQFLQDLQRLTALPQLSGDDFTWLPALSVGAAGVVSVLSNVAPADCVALFQAWERGDPAAARSIHARLYPLVQYLFSTTNPIPAKAALAAMGLCARGCRAPLVAGEPPPPALLDGVA
jgi:4-hydroxy-tetrahydrodipicolinate synthase